MLRRALLLGAPALALAACVPTPATPPYTILPGYEFAIGANLADIVAVIGPPRRGPIRERWSNLDQSVWSWPFPALTVETSLKDGSVRSEETTTIHVFTNAAGRVVSMTHRPDPYYPTHTDAPVTRVRVAPRARFADGTIGALEIAR